MAYTTADIAALPNPEPSVSYGVANNYLTQAKNAAHALLDFALTHSPQPINPFDLINANRAAPVVPAGTPVLFTVAQLEQIIAWVGAMKGASFQLAAIVSDAMPALNYYADPNNYATVQRTYVAEDAGATARNALAQIDPT